MTRSTALALFLTAAITRPALADDTLRTAIADIAKDIAGTLRNTQDGGVRIGPFRDPAKGGGGPGLSVVLKQELERFGVRPRADGAEVRGEFVPNPTRAGPEVRVKGTVVGRDGKAVATFDKLVRDERALAALFGPTFASKGDAPAAGPQFFQQLRTPTAFADGPRVRAAKGATFAVEVLVGPAGGAEDAFNARPAVVANGRATVSLKRGEAYALRLTNAGAQEAWASVSVDGINIYAFSTVKDAAGRPKFSRVVIDPKSAVVIRGWHHTHAESEQFVLTEFEKGAAAELGAQAAGVGVIAVAFGLANPKATTEDGNGGKRGLRLSPANPRAADVPGQPADATGRGQKVPQQFLEAEREYGPAREFVGIRYTR